MRRLYLFCLLLQVAHTGHGQSYHYAFDWIPRDPADYVLEKAHLFECKEFERFSECERIAFKVGIDVLREELISVTYDSSFLQPKGKLESELVEKLENVILQGVKITEIADLQSLERPEELQYFYLVIIMDKKNRRKARKIIKKCEST